MAAIRVQKAHKNKDCNWRVHWHDVCSSPFIDIT